MEDFYVTLSSNACTEYYPENTVGRFWNLLASPLELKEHTDGRGWEVGLTDICIPAYNTQFELGKKDYTFTFWNGPPNYDGIAPPQQNQFQTHEVGHFWSVIEFEKTFNQLLKNKKLQGAASHVRLDQYERFGVIRLKTPKNVFVKFSENMMKVLGFEKKDTNEHGFFGSHKKKCVTWGHFDPWVGTRSLWVYSDCCEYRAVGGSRVPLLRTVGVTKYEVSDLIQRQYPTPMYIPVRQHYIHAIELNITDNTGGNLTFFPGEAVVTLHFRRRPLSDG